MKNHFKKIIIGSFLTIGLGLSYSFTTLNNKESNPETIDDGNCKYGQCIATASSTGERCRRCTAKYESYCSSHRGY
ncbi:hypothetical protein [Tenacibaculum piscium]|uniref:hypothetical protein n=1 Tax=Tenacibaculum piscium TaxID=1458515 RepID=UPI001F184A65|nr:hypothetical protein [Tenacibaculum piscium]